MSADTIVTPHGLEPILAGSFVTQNDIDVAILDIFSIGPTVPNAGYHAFANVPANGKPAPVRVNYNSAFPVGIVPIPWFSIQNPNNAQASAAFYAPDNAGFTLSLLSHAGTIQSFTVWIYAMVPTGGAI